MKDILNALIEYLGGWRNNLIVKLSQARLLYL